MHGLLVLYTLIAAMYVYVLMYRPNMSYYRRRFNVRPAPAKAIAKTIGGAAMAAGLGVAAAGAFVPKRFYKSADRGRLNPPLGGLGVAAAGAAPPQEGAPVAAPIVTHPVAAPPPPPAQAPMMTPATAPPTTPAPIVAPAMTPSADSPEDEDEEEVGNNTDSGYMAEYPPLF